MEINYTENNRLFFVDFYGNTSKKFYQRNCKDCGKIYITCLLFENENYCYFCKLNNTSWFKAGKQILPILNLEHPPQCFDQSFRLNHICSICKVKIPNYHLLCEKCAYTIPDEKYFDAWKITVSSRPFFEL